MADRIKFYLNEHVQKAMAEGLRRRSDDVITVQELDLQAAEDVPHLERANQDGRVIVTQDADFLQLHATGHPHQGIVYAPQHISVLHMLRSLMLIHDVMPAKDMIRHIEFL